MTVQDPPLLPVAAGYRNVLRARIALTWFPAALAAVVAERQFLGGSVFSGLAGGAAVVLAVAAVAILPQRRYRRLRYRLTDSFVQSLRGWLVHVDTIVPLIRVQHLDVTRGPLDKAFGTASLVVHTAGTHNKIVTIDGLAGNRAEEMRDLIRAQVRPDIR